MKKEKTIKKIKEPKKKILVLLYYKNFKIKKQKNKVLEKSGGGGEIL